jgi:hypothetical protein
MGRARPPADEPPLSVILATTRGWAEARPCLERLLGAARPVGAEVVVADGSAAPPPPGALPPGLRWLREPGAGVFVLRALARRAARGPLLAVTEDHCLVAPDWCARLLDAFARHPEAVAVKGAVRNGSRARLVHWAAFVMNQGPHVPPFRGGRDDALLGVSCAAYRRQALARLLPEAAGPLDLLDTRTWRDAGETVVADPAAWVEHHEPLSFLAVSAVQYHNARAVAGLRRGRPTPRDGLRLAGAPALAVTRAARTVAAALRRDLPRGRVLAAAPLVLWLYAWKAAGEVAGYLAGPGNSAARLR